jgi:UDP-3-O-[3-hydroxymyristoyl] glucosamine N-acyltransferase
VENETVFIHPEALCESDHIGARTRIWAFAHLLPGATVGSDCNVCDAVFIEGRAVVGDRVTIKNGVLIWDGVTLEDDVFLGPGVIFTNDLRPRAHIRRSVEELLPTIVRRGATLGAGAVVVCGLTIGEHAFVAAGAVVVRDVPAFGFIRGNPGRRVGWTCVCGERLPASLACACGRVFDESKDADGPSELSLISAPDGSFPRD